MQTYKYTLSLSLPPSFVLALSLSLTPSGFLSPSLCILPFYSKLSTFGDNNMHNHRNMSMHTCLQTYKHLLSLSLPPSFVLSHRLSFSLPLSAFFLFTATLFDI